MSADARIGWLSISGETDPGTWKSVKIVGSGRSGRIASRTFSPPRIPFSQSWTTAVFMTPGAVNREP